MPTPFLPQQRAANNTYPRSRSPWILFLVFCLLSLCALLCPTTSLAATQTSSPTPPFCPTTQAIMNLDLQKEKAFALRYDKNGWNISTGAKASVRFSGNDRVWVFNMWPLSYQYSKTDAIAIAQQMLQNPPAPFSTQATLIDLSNGNQNPLGMNMWACIYTYDGTPHHIQFMLTSYIPRGN